MENVTIGKIVNTVGIQGDMKCYPYSDFMDVHLKIGKTLYLWNETTNQYLSITLTHARMHGSVYVLHFDGIHSVEEAEKYRDWFLQIPKIEQVKLPKNTFFYPDLIGCEVLDSMGRPNGLVKEVLNYGSHPLLRVIQSGKEDVLIPFLDAFIRKVDIQTKTIVIQEMEGLFNGD